VRPSKNGNMRDHITKLAAQTMLKAHYYSSSSAAMCLVMQHRSVRRQTLARLRRTIVGRQRGGGLRRSRRPARARQIAHVAETRQLEQALALGARRRPRQRTAASPSTAPALAPEQGAGSNARLADYAALAGICAALAGVREGPGLPTAD